MASLHHFPTQKVKADPLVPIRSMPVFAAELRRRGSSASQLTQYTSTSNVSHQAHGPSQVCPELPTISPQLRQPNAQGIRSRDTRLASVTQYQQDFPRRVVGQCRSSDLSDFGRRADHPTARRTPYRKPSIGSSERGVSSARTSESLTTGSRQASCTTGRHHGSLINVPLCESYTKIGSIRTQQILDVQPKQISPLRSVRSAAAQVVVDNAIRSNPDLLFAPAAHTFDVSPKPTKKHSDYGKVVRRGTKRAVHIILKLYRGNGDVIEKERKERRVISAPYPDRTGHLDEGGLWVDGLDRRDVTQPLYDIRSSAVLQTDQEPKQRQHACSELDRPVVVVGDVRRVTQLGDFMHTTRSVEPSLRVATNATKSHSSTRSPVRHLARLQESSRSLPPFASSSVYSVHDDSTAYGESKIDPPLLPPVTCLPGTYTPFSADLTFSKGRKSHRPSDVHSAHDLDPQQPPYLRNISRRAPPMTFVPGMSNESVQNLMPAPLAPRKTSGTVSRTSSVSNLDYNMATMAVDDVFPSDDDDRRDGDDSNEEALQDPRAYPDDPSLQAEIDRLHGKLKERHHHLEEPIVDVRVHSGHTSFLITEWIDEDTITSHWYREPRRAYDDAGRGLV